MRQAGIILGMLLLTLSLVAASNSYDADFSKNPTHIITLNEGDEIRVFYNGTEHSIILDNINYEEGIVNLEMFYNLKDYGYGLLREGIMIRMDFEKDGPKEVSIELYDIGEDYATLLLTDLNYEKTLTTGQATTETITTKEVGVVGQTNPWVKYIIFAILIIGGILAFRLMKDNPKNDKENNVPETKPKIKIPDEVEEHEKRIESENQDNQETKDSDKTEENSLEEE